MKSYVAERDVLNVLLFNKSKVVGGGKNVSWKLQHCANVCLYLLLWFPRSVATPISFFPLYLLIFILWIMSWLIQVNQRLCIVGVIFKMLITEHWVSQCQIVKLSSNRRVNLPLPSWHSPKATEAAGACSLLFNERNERCDLCFVCLNPLPENEVNGCGENQSYIDTGSV